MGRIRAKYIVFLIVVLTVVAYWHYCGASRTPPGQPPLTSLVLGNLDQFRHAFNDVGDRPRLVLLVSPT